LHYTNTAISSYLYVSQPSVQYRTEIINLTISRCIGCIWHIDANIKKRSGITDSEIDKCKKNGLENISDMGIAKDLSKKYNQQLKKVLEIKTQLIFWDKVENELISQSANSKKSSEVTKWWKINLE